MKIIVMGYKRHGKDFACEYLNSMFGRTYSSSSWMACKLFLYEQLKTKYGYTSAEQCFNDRHNHRAEWFNAIRAYNDPDLCRLGKQIFASHDIYCGIRNREEFEALRDQKLFDYAVWVDATARIGEKEDITSMELTPDDADVIIDNNRSPLELYHQLDEFHSAFFERPYDQNPKLSATSMSRMRVA